MYPIEGNVQVFRAPSVQCNTIIALGLKFDWQFWIPNRIRVLTICSLSMQLAHCPYRRHMIYSLTDI